MNQSKESKRSPGRPTESEQNIQLQMREYGARYYPGGRDVAAALSARKPRVNAGAPNRQRRPDAER